MSKIINGIIQRLKGNSGNKIYNYKLTNLKIVKLCDNNDLERSKLNPFVKGFLLDESKGEYENINLNSNNLYNKENTKILKQIFNTQIHHNSWFDNFKNYLFGNSLFNKKAIKNQGSQDKKLNFAFNCTGNLIAFINKEGDLIISIIQMNYSFCIKANLISNEGICSFNWDLINPYKIFYSSKSTLYESVLNLEKEEKLYINKYYSLNSKNFINCFPSPKGDLLILLYKNSIEIYDTFHQLIFSKYFYTFNFVNGTYDNKSTLFIAFSENDIILFNLKHLEFLTYSDFPGKIIKVISSKENDNIYIFILNEENKLFMYTLKDISISSDIKLNFNSYQNYDIFYRHHNYVLSPEIFGFQYKLAECYSKILDVNFSYKEQRIAILYEEQFRDNIKQNSLYIYIINKDKRENTIEKILPLYNFGHIDNNQICSFGFGKMINEGKSFMVVRLDDDKFIKTNNIFR